jgi:hypothetical protein
MAQKNPPVGWFRHHPAEEILEGDLAIPESPSKMIVHSTSPYSTEMNSFGRNLAVQMEQLSHQQHLI